MAKTTTEATETIQPTTKAPLSLTCPLCSRDNSYILRYGVRDDPGYPIYHCRHCDLQFLTPAYDDIREFYRQEYRLQHECSPGTVMTSEQRFSAMRPLMQDRASRFKKFVPPGASVLEVGCSAGFFLDAIGDKYDRFGSEWNLEDAAFVRDIREMPCEEDDLLEVYGDRKFTAIAALDVLEHQLDPAQFLRDCKERLIGGGYLYLEVPNARDALLTVYGIDGFAEWWYRKPHITYWTRETLAATLGALGFEARINGAQRYGLMNHLNWLLNEEPMANVQEAQLILQPVSDQHPLAGIMNRSIGRLDKEYRADMESLGCNDTLVALCRRREI